MSFVRVVVILSSLCMVLLGLVMMTQMRLLIGDLGYNNGAKMLSQLWGVALIGLGGATALAATRRDWTSLRYLCGAQTVHCAAAPAIFALNIGVFDHLYFSTGQTLFVWMILWIVIFGAPMLLGFVVARGR